MGGGIILVGSLNDGVVWPHGGGAVARTERARNVEWDCSEKWILLIGQDRGGGEGLPPLRDLAFRERQSRNQCVCVCVCIALVAGVYNVR